ncbi:MAG: endonuclease MutS2 [Oscillospiraceae bacterium]
MNKYLKTIELHKVLEMLEEQASNEKTREMIRKTEPFSDIDTVKKELQKTVDAFDLSVKNGTPSFNSFKNVTGSLRRAQSGASLSLRELLDIAQMLRQIDILTDWYSACGEIDTTLNYLFESLTPNAPLEKRITDSILSEDEIADTASPELGDIRRKISRAGLKIRDSLDKMIKSSEVQKSLQENIITMRDGRFVLPVKSEHKGTVPGIVHASSASGSTLFIEPIAVVEANNDIQILKDREKEEIERIIAEMSAECGRCAESVIADYDTCAEINLYFAKANLGAKMKASVPEISDDGKIELKKARHPLIDPAKVVPVDIKLGYDFDTLIITGPNTGGKTVLLKTTGLLTAMAMCGLMIPAGDGSHVSVFDNILVDIGDMQSIENELSTFSSHISNVVEICNKADSSSLILLDELGSGTDPVEGAALAVAIINNLRTWNCRMMVTTHYQELKMYAVETKGVENGSCEFDVNTFQPTYKLIIGSPGKSNAFYISSRLGISEDIIRNAKELVSDENTHFEEVVAQLERSRIEYDKLNEEARALKAEQEQLKADLEKEKQRLEASKDSEFERARIEARRIVENCRMESDKLLDELNKLRKEKNKADFEQAASQAKSRSRSAIDKMYKEANPVRGADNSDYKLPRPLKRGDSVFIVSMNKNGIVAGDPDSSGNVFVQAGIMKTKTTVSNLRLVEKPAADNTPKKRTPAGRSGITPSGKKIQRRPQLELDIRGMNVDEGIIETDAFIDNAVMTHAGIVTIIHGKGTGILREGIQRHLKSHPSVKSFRNGLFGEGEEGVTIVELK